MNNQFLLNYVSRITLSCKNNLNRRKVEPTPSTNLLTLLFSSMNFIFCNFVITQKHTTMKIEYRNIYIHYVLTTLHRIPMISEGNRNRIEKYITGIISNTGSQLYAVYCNPEHTHILLSKSPDISDNELIGKIAISSARFINENKLCCGKFAWQDSASAFSISKGDVDKIYKYILNQNEHHKKVNFEEEYQTFIKYYQNKIFQNKSSS